MDEFYEGVVDSSGSKAMALRSAIMSLKAEPGYGHPYYWSPFFLSGDWR
jgi:CHAT domain-containing protein